MKTIFIGCVVIVILIGIWMSLSSVFGKVGSFLVKKKR